MSSDGNTKYETLKSIEVVHVLWNDACEGDTMEDVDMLVCPQETIGFLFKEQEGNIYVARDWDGMNKEYSQCIRIPLIYVVSMNRIKL